MKKASVSNLNIEKIESDLLNRLKEHINNGDTLDCAIKKSLLDTLIDNEVVTTGRKIYTYKGETGTVKHLCNVFNLNYHRVRYRLESGYSLEIAISGEGIERGRKEGNGKQITYKGVTGNLRQLCEHFGLNYKYVHRFMRVHNLTDVESLNHHYNLKLKRENK